MRADVKDIRQEVNELKVSVNFANANYDDMKKKHTNMETELKAVYHQIKGLNQNLNNGIEALESKIEYLGNHSRRNNIKVIGVEEKADEKTWDDTEKVAKKVIKEKLGIEGDIMIERAHRVGEKLNHAPSRHADSNSNPSGSYGKQHRPMIAKFKSWKEKEKVVRVARKKKPKGIPFMNDLARRTLDRRAEKIPQMLEHRKNGKTAFMIMDKLIVYDQKPPDNGRTSGRTYGHNYENDFGFDANSCNVTYPNSNH